MYYWLFADVVEGERAGWAWCWRLRTGWDKKKITLLQTKDKIKIKNATEGRLWPWEHEYGLNRVASVIMFTARKTEGRSHKKKTKETPVRYFYVIDFMSLMISLLIDPWSQPEKPIVTVEKDSNLPSYISPNAIKAESVPGEQRYPVIMRPSTNRRETEAIQELRLQDTNECMFPQEASGRIIDFRANRKMWTQTLK